MPWFLVVALTIVVAFTVLVALGLLWRPATERADSERFRVEMEVRRAERRLHTIASNSFQAMLDEARKHDTER
jgi:hypothetical protein